MSRTEYIQAWETSYQHHYIMTATQEAPMLGKEGKKLLRRAYWEGGFAVFNDKPIHNVIG